MPRGGVGDKEKLEPHQENPDHAEKGLFADQLWYGSGHPRWAGIGSGWPGLSIIELD